jgi:hypothetical protein
MPQGAVAVAAGQLRADPQNAAVTTQQKEQTPHDPGT